MKGARGCDGRRRDGRPARRQRVGLFVMACLDVIDSILGPGPSLS